jgi:hypothetical protein
MLQSWLTTTDLTGKNGCEVCFTATTLWLNYKKNIILYFLTLNLNTMHKTGLIRLQLGLIHMKFSMTGQEKRVLLIQVTVWAGLTVYIVGKCTSFRNR